MTGRVLLVAVVALAGCVGSPPKGDRPPPAAGAPLLPEEVLRRIEETMTAAKSVRIRCRCEQIVRVSSGREDRFSLEGTALLKDDSKVQLAFRGIDSAGDARGVSVLSDGSRVTWRLGFTIPAQECGLPKSFRGTVQRLVGRLGLAFSALLVAGRLQIDGDRMDTGTPRAVDFSKGEDDASSPWISYRVYDPGGKAVAAKLWYEKSSFRPQKRIVTREEGSQSLSFVETYQEYALDAAVADSEFAAPPSAPMSSGETSNARRIATDSAGWTILIDKPQGTVSFILLVAPGGTVSESEPGLQLKRGSTTINLSGSRGVMLSGKGGVSTGAIPEGWARDLVREYRARLSSQPDLTIRRWLQDELRRNPSPFIEPFVQKE
jgi:hypothetical protein